MTEEMRENEYEMMEDFCEEEDQDDQESGRPVERIFISACLGGMPCRYDGKPGLDERVFELMRENECVFVCPELYAGLSTPRTRCERIGKRVIDENGVDVTDAYVRGARKVLDMAKRLKPAHIYLKRRSPSCGVTEIYDGTFTGRLIPGMGITAEMLAREGFDVREL